MPNRFNVAQGGDLRSVTNTMNQNFAMLDKEVESKVFFDRATNTTLTLGKTGDTTSGMQAVVNDLTAMHIGKYDSNHYGILLYDASGVPVVLIGQAPDDGRMGSWQVKPGRNVITDLGG